MSCPSALIGETRHLPATPFVPDVDGVRHELEAMLVAVGNTSSYGGDADLPARQGCDGLLDVTVVTRISRAKLMGLFPRVYPGAHVRRPEVLTFRGRSVRLTAGSVVAYADGERVAPLPVSCTVAPASLAVLGFNGH